MAEMSSMWFAIATKRSKNLQVVSYTLYSNADADLQLSTCLHLHLHGPASLEGVAASNDQGKVVGPKF